MQRLPRLTLLVLVLAGCNGGAVTGPTPTAGEPTGSRAAVGAAGRGAGALLELTLDQTTEFAHLEVTWRELGDSRCRRGVQCVWEGEAIVTLRLSTGAEEPPELVELGLRAGTPGGPRRSAGYEWRLLAVEPYPTEGTTTARASYVARIEATAIEPPVD